MRMRSGAITTVVSTTKRFAAYSPHVAGTPRHVRVKDLKARIAQVSNEIEQHQRELDGLRSELVDVEEALDAALNSPIEGGVDPTGWLPTEMMLMVLLHVPFLGACGRVCRRWSDLCRDVNRENTVLGMRWSSYNRGLLTPSQLFEHTSALSAIAVGPNNTVCTGSDDGTVQVWSTVDQKCLRVLKGHTDGVTSVEVGRDGTIYSGSDDRTIRVWSGDDGSHLATLTGHTDHVVCLAIGKNNLLFSGSDDIKVWKPIPDLTGRSFVLEHTLIGHTDLVWSISLSPSEDTLYSSSEATVRVWSVANGCLLTILEGHESAVFSVVVSKLGTVFSGSSDGTVRVWSGIDGRLLRMLSYHEDSIESLLLGPDDEVICCSFDGTMVRVCTRTGRCLGRIVHKINSGRYFVNTAIGSDGRIYRTLTRRCECV